MMKVNFIGAIGGGNFGDELILNVCKEEYLKFNIIDYTYSGFGKNIIFKEKKVNIDSNSGINFFETMLQLRDMFFDKKEVCLSDILNIFNNYQRIDIIHFIGGGYINNLWSANYALVAIAYLYSLKYEIPIFATGLGLIPNCDDLLVFELFNNFDVVDVRDFQSNELISSSSCSGDDVLLKFEQLEIYNTDPSLILSLQSHLFSNQEILEKLFSHSTLKLIKDQGINNIIIIEAAPEDIVPFDRNYIKAASDLLLNIEFLTAEYLIKFGIPYNINNKVISSRYHIHLIYSMLNIEGIALYENDYYKNKHFSVIGMGGKWPIMDKNSFIKKLNTQELFTYKYQSNMDKFMELSNKKKDVFQNIFEIINGYQKKGDIETNIDKALKIINTYIGT